MPKKKTPSADKVPQWVSTLTLKTHYFDLKDDFLSSQIKNGSLKLGKHYLIASSPKASRRTVLWNPEALAELWGMDPAFRSLHSRS